MNFFFFCHDNEFVFIVCFMIVKEFPTAYSPSDAVGVWLSPGTVGECLSPDSSNDHTYYSNDSGLKWYTMAKDRVSDDVYVACALWLRLTTCDVCAGDLWSEQSRRAHHWRRDGPTHQPAHLLAGQRRNVSQLQFHRQRRGGQQHSDAFVQCA